MATTGKDKAGAKGAVKKSESSDAKKRAAEAKRAEEEAARKAAEAEAEEDEDEEEDDDEEGEEDEAEEAVSARPARRRAAEAADDEVADEADEGEEIRDEEDPYWWTPHLALSVIVLIGVLGFFGVFNRVLGPHVPRPLDASAFEDDTPKAASTPQPAHEPEQRPRPGAEMKAPSQQDATMYGAKHLLVMYKGSMRAPATITRTKEEAKKRAQEAHDKAKKGAKFEDLVKEYSDEPGAGARGGDLGKFRKGQMVPAFQEAVEKLKVGEVSDLVETPFGYHVILRTQ